MKVPFYLFTIFLGIILAVHLSMNGKVGSALGNPRVGNALFWCVGAATAVLRHPRIALPNCICRPRSIRFLDSHVRPEPIEEPAANNRRIP